MACCRKASCPPLQEMLRAHRDALEVATTQLLERESLTGQELEDLVAAHPPAPGSGAAPQREAVRA
jgi:ATP-dependent Zn protease